MEATTRCDQFYLSNCRRIFHKFLEKNIELCDVSLIGDDGTYIKCHRFVLAACSPVFERVFENYTKQTGCGDVQKKDLVILLAAYKSQNVQNMVDYIYYGQLPELHWNNDDDNVRLDLILI